MSAYLITGVSGVGKSTVIAKLAGLGFQTYTDNDHRLAGFYSSTGKRLRQADWPNAHPFDFNQFKYRWHVPAVKRLIASHSDTIFIGGGIGNVTALFPLFDTVFVLQPSLETLKYRLRTRTTNEFGKNPDEVAHILESFDPTGDFWRDLGAVVINTNQPVEAVTNEILAHVNDKAAQ
jgi:guanylate kinase